MSQALIPENGNPVVARELLVVEGEAWKRNAGVRRFAETTV